MAARRKEIDPQSEAMLRLRQNCQVKLGLLRTERYSWWTHWRELADYLLPRRYKWLITPNQGNRGSPINQRIVDSTGTVALRILASGMMSGLTSPGRPWFRLTVDDPDLAEYAPVKMWLDDTTNRMLTVFAESNFYNALSVMYQDLACFGTATMIMYEDYEDVIRCYNSCAGEYFLANGARMNVDTFYREFVMTTRQIADEFGIENVSPTVSNAVKRGGGPTTRELIIQHAIEPNTEYEEGVPGARGMPYRELYWEAGSGRNYTLRYRGFHEFPVIAPRWDIVANDPYGRSPGMDVLGDVKQLQVEQKRKAQGIDKMVNPPLRADVSMKNEPASVLPGGVTYVTGQAGEKGFSPVYEVKPDLSHMVEDLKEVHGRIKSGLYNDIFLMISDLETVRSATEIDARRQEQLVQLGPVVERFENEALDPGVERTFNVMARAGLIAPPPRELSDKHVKVEYVSILSQAQKAVMTTGIERFVSFVGRIGAAVPSAMDNVDWDEMVDQYADYLGVSPKVIVPYAKVMQARAQRQAKEQQQAALQTSLAAAQGAKTLSDTDVGGGANALQMMMNGPSAQPMAAAA